MAVIRKTNIFSGDIVSLLSWKRWSLYSLLLFISTGFLLSVTQIYGESPDYANYDIFFDYVRSERLYIIFMTRFEPGFSAIAVFFTTLFATNVVVYSSFVVLAMALKGLAMSFYSSNQKIFLVVAVFYLARYFPFHELTQLRVACAIGFLMIGSYFSWRGEYIKGLFSCLLALLFHMASAIIVPACFIKSTKIRTFLFIIFCVFVVAYSGAELLTSYLASYIKVFGGYEYSGFGDNSPNPFSVALLLDWSMIAVALLMWRHLSILMKRVVFFQLIGMALFYALLGFPVMAHRFRELFNVFWVFFVADGLRVKYLQFPVACFVVLSIGLYSYFYIFSGTFFQ